MEKVKILSTLEIKRCNAEAERRNYNRQLATEFLATLDPDGIHVVDYVMPHEYAGGEITDLHWRCGILCKQTGHSKPARAYLDIEKNLFNQLEEREIIYDRNRSDRISSADTVGPANNGKSA